MGSKDKGGKEARKPAQMTQKEKKAAKELKKKNRPNA